MDMAKMDRIKIDDLKLRPDVFAVRLQRRAKLRDVINAQMPAVEKAVEKEHLDEYYTRALNLVTSGRARDAFDLSPRSRRHCATATAGTRSAKAACSPAAWSKPARASSKSSGRRSPIPTIIPGTITPT